LTRWRGSDWFAGRRVVVTGGAGFLGSHRSAIAFVDRPVDDPGVRRPDITSARELLGWEPTVPWDEGLARTIIRFERMRSPKAALRGCRRSARPRNPSDLLEGDRIRRPSKCVITPGRRLAVIGVRGANDRGSRIGSQAIRGPAPDQHSLGSGCCRLSNDSRRRRNGFFFHEPVACRQRPNVKTFCGVLPPGRNVIR
jgi:hypothetical protein